VEQLVFLTGQIYAVKRFCDSRPWILKWYVLVCRVVIGLVLIASGVAKVNHSHGFLLAVYRFRLVDADSSLLVAAVLPWLEVLAGAALLVGYCTGGAFVLASAMLLSFCFVLASALWRDLSISCGCFGSSAEPIGYSDLVRTSGLFLVSALALIGCFMQKCVEMNTQNVVRRELECLMGTSKN